MRLIGITTESILTGEAACINGLFREGLALLHVRKPQVAEEELERFIVQACDGFFGRVVLHDHFPLAGRLGLRGVHLNSRNPYRPEGVASVSRSCHTLEELKDTEGFEYRFFSPVFASISKPGYCPLYTPEQLKAAGETGTIGGSVVALGGIGPETIPVAAEYGFGGVAVLGALWGNFAKDGDRQSVVDRFYKLKEICERL